MHAYLSEFRQNRTIPLFKKSFVLLDSCYATLLLVLRDLGADIEK